MGISKFEMYHGAVLTEVVRNPEMSLKLIERDKEKHSWGMYEVLAGNKDYVLFIKSSSKVYTGKTETYSRFTFSKADIERLKRYTHDTKTELILCLVCHDENICLLTENEIDSLRLLASEKPCGISAYWKHKSELRVASTFAELNHRVPRNRLKNFDWGNGSREK